MLLFTQQVFNSYISGTQSVFTDYSLADALGKAERLSFTFAVRGVTGTSVTIAFTIEGSPDGTRWIAQSGGPDYQIGLSSGDNTNFYFTNQSNVPFLGRIRIRATLGGTSPAGVLQMWVVGRTPAS